MKRLATLAVSLTMLLLIAFGSGGVVAERCACSGRTSLFPPPEEDCCTGEASCMTTYVLPAVGQYMGADDVAVPADLLSFIPIEGYTIPVAYSSFSLYKAVQWLDCGPPIGAKHRVEVMRV